MNDQTLLPKRLKWPLFLGLALLMLLGLWAVYSNHFRNAFHFDDSHVIENNLYIRDLSHIPLFFEDGRTFSSQPSNQSYRPLLSVTYALDYHWGGGSPFPFHVTSFCFFVAQLGVMFALFLGVLEAGASRAANRWVALLAVGLYAFHPANAETVNYISARSDIVSTLAVVAGLAWFVWFPAGRKWGLYLLPPLLGILAKATTAAFAPILLCYLALFEPRGKGKTLLASLPSFGAMLAGLFFLSKMNPPTFTTGGASASRYLITQPFVIFHYFRTFFAPDQLSADTDWGLLASAGDDRFWAGCLFIALLIAAAFWAARRRETKPVAFGLAFFLLGLLPTSVTPLAEVLNDHRMFFPFVGLALSVSCVLGLGFDALGRRFSGPVRTALGSAVVLVLLSALGWGTHRRNEVWKSEESLWLDVTQKSPANGRGLMNYGLTQMALGRYDAALRYFNAALVYCPAYYTLEINLAIVKNALGKADEAERHFRRALALGPNYPAASFYYGRWLVGRGRLSEGEPLLQKAIALSPASIDARKALLSAYATGKDWGRLKAAAEALLQLVPGDREAKRHLAKAQTGLAQALLQESLTLFQSRRYERSIAASRRALELKPGLAEAHNNLGAAFGALGRWEEEIAACEEALRLNPDFELAKNNLAWAKSQLASKTGAIPGAAKK